MYSTGDGYRNCRPRRIPIKEEVILKRVKNQNEAATGARLRTWGKKDGFPVVAAT
jgi:hypothetical protein